jgi:hypothetical protein
MTLFETLAEQCWNLPNAPEALYYRRFNTHQFAQLVVQECAWWLEAQGRAAVAGDMKARFGVTP